MKASALQLEQYFVSDLNVTANRQHKPQEPIQVPDSHLEITPTFLPQEGRDRHWQVVLCVQLKASNEVNTPYFFMAEIVGFFSVDAAYPENKAEWLVRTNATSILYSTLREILRGVMAQGPFRPLLLPTASFYTPETFKMLDESESTLPHKSNRKKIAGPGKKGAK